MNYQREFTAQSTASNRYNPYTNIHKGLRAFMADTLITVGQTDGQDAEQVEAASAAVRSLLVLCRAHLDQEDRFIHPALESCAPHSSVSCAEDHFEHLREFNQLELHLEHALLLTSVGAADAPQVWLSLYLHLNQFVAENYLHMQKEEQENMAVLWRHYSDEQLMALSKQLVASITPEEMALSMRWMLPNLNHHERLVMLGGLKAQAPAHVFNERMVAVKAVLNQRDWDKLVVGLSLNEREAA
jgi:hypothetical protein